MHIIRHSLLNQLTVQIRLTNNSHTRNQKGQKKRPPHYNAHSGCVHEARVCVMCVDYTYSRSTMNGTVPPVKTREILQQARKDAQQFVCVPNIRSCTVFLAESNGFGRYRPIPRFESSTPRGKGDPRPYEQIKRDYHILVDYKPKLHRQRTRTDETTGRFYKA